MIEGYMGSRKEWTSTWKKYMLGVIKHRNHIRLWKSAECKTSRR